MSEMASLSALHAAAGSSEVEVAFAEGREVAERLLPLLRERRLSALDPDRGFIDDAQTEALILSVVDAQSEPFTLDSLADEVAPLIDWANRVIMENALLCMVLDRRVSVRMAEDGEPRFTITAARPAVLPVGKAGRPNRALQTERNREICERRRAGAKLAVIAKEFGISIPRVSVICKAEVA